MKTEECLLNFWEISTQERYYQTVKITLPITNYSHPFHGPCMNAAWFDLGNSPPRRKHREKVQVN